MLPRVKPFCSASTGRRLGYMAKCPACEMPHLFYTTPRTPEKPTWSFNGDLQYPTFDPSMGVRWEDGNGVKHYCHSFLRNGTWVYLVDSTHMLAGSSAEAIEYED